MFTNKMDVPVHGCVENTLFMKRKFKMSQICERQIAESNPLESAVPNN
ncbi:hypothetical protein BC643_1803 [Mangrovibacterium diazotrophicum]|uniref:Uncharacterized protein n=1 Tax=Mangrovibacterium diazotrophicum TaxID=1261403 RepID=A0A419W7L4_9BACT|nr:hypothetical protein BC643_1803 [Mangrovibacterium diazotrophicum]